MPCLFTLSLRFTRILPRYCGLGLSGEERAVVGGWGRSFAAGAVAEELCYKASGWKLLNNVRLCGDYAEM